jgi:hypothetical protein
MHDSEANRFSLDPWTDLLRQARSALGSLRADDLEELAGRAECMLEATAGSDPIRQRISGPARRTTLGLVQEQGLLRNLLIETDTNLKVLRRACQDRPGSARGGEVNSRWAL